MGDKWRYYQSPNFELYSGNNDRESRDLLFKLEVLRAFFLERLKLKERLPLPVTVYYFDSEKTFRAYWPEAYQENSNFVGFYFSRPDRAVISMAPADDEDDASSVVFHEYIHHLMKVTEQNPPAWYNEGMAEIFSTIKLEDDLLLLGRTSAGRIRALQHENLLPLDQLFSINKNSPVFTKGKHTGVFYAQSWALLHFCYFGQSGLPKEKLDLFLKVARSPLYNDPQKVREICRELLGMDYEQLTQALTRYVRNGQYRFAKLPQPQVPDRKTYAARAVPAEEISDRLAELEFRVKRTPQARLALLLAAERSPTDPRPHEVLGAMARLEGEDVPAREQWNKALELGSENPAVLHELGQMESQRWFSRFDLYFRLPDERASYLRDLLVRSLKVAPNQSAAYEMLAWVEASANEPRVENINLVQEHFPEMRNKERTLLALALVRWRKEDTKTALSILDELTKAESSDPGVQYGVETLRAKIEGRAPVRTAPGGVRKTPVKLPPIKLPTF